MKKIFVILSLLLVSACNKPAIDTPSASVLIIQTCAIDQPLDNLKISTNQLFNVGGWIFDKDSKMVNAPQIHVQFTSLDRAIVKVLDASPNTRPDVAEALKDPSAAASGFSIDIKPQTLVPNNYEITILLKQPNIVVACGLKRNIVVTE